MTRIYCARKHTCLRQGMAPSANAYQGAGGSGPQERGLEPDLAKLQALNPKVMEPVLHLEF